MGVKLNEQRYHATVIEITGKFLGSVDGPKFKDLLEELKEEGKTQVVVDLAQTEFMDSSGVGVLISGLTTMRKADGDMRLANLKKRIRNLFMMTHLLGPVFENYESVEEAAQSFEDHPKPPESKRTEQ